MDKQHIDGIVTKDPQTPAPSTSEPLLHTSQPDLPPADPIPHNSEQVNAPKADNGHHVWKGFFSVVNLIAGAVILAFFINKVVFQSYEVFGQSMTPTLQEGDRLIINKLGKSWASLFNNDYRPKRGDIIVFHNPHSPSVQLVKRVIAFPGERVVVTDGTMTIFTADDPGGINYDQLLDLELLPTVGDVDLSVPEGELFVSGDNRGPGGSLDSRNELGTVPIDQIVGDLAFRIFPLNDVSAF